MSKTTYFDLNKPALTDSAAVEQFNENMDTIDTEMHKPPLTVNGSSPDANRNIQISTVSLADNLTTDEQQIIDGTFIARTSGGEASIDSGSAFLSSVRGNMVKTGYYPQSCEISVTNATRPDPDDEGITASVVADTFRDAVDNTTGTYTFTYGTGWTLGGNSVTLSDYGISITGTPYSGDIIVVQFVKETRGTISTADPSEFISTGWNLYNHTTGRARVCRYSDDEGYMISGSYLILEFATTITGQRSQITPVNGYFNVPGDGWLFVTGGNDTDTEIWTVWTDWTDEPNGGTFEAYTESTIDLSGVMVNFPDGLMRVGNVYDEINLNTGIAYARIARLDYDDYIAEVIASGQDYDTDTNYVYVVRKQEAFGNIPAIGVYDATAVSGTYTVNDHGIEYFAGTTVAVVSQNLYGQDLKNKLRRDVVTISPQELNPAQQEQVRQNIGAAAQEIIPSLFVKKKFEVANLSFTAGETKIITRDQFGFTIPTGYKYFCIAGVDAGSKYLAIARFNGEYNNILYLSNPTSSARSSITASISVIFVKDIGIYA